VVWFGEPLPLDTWNASEQAAQEADVFLVIGTSALVYPAAGLVHIAKSAGARIIEINPESTSLSSLVDVAWRASAAEALPQLIRPPA
jgi:NAD-dependent deacetylase